MFMEEMLTKRQRRKKLRESEKVQNAFVCFLFHFWKRFIFFYQNKHYEVTYVDSAFTSYILRLNLSIGVDSPSDVRHMLSINAIVVLSGLFFSSHSTKYNTLPGHLQKWLQQLCLHFGSMVLILILLFLQSSLFQHRMECAYFIAIREKQDINELSLLSIHPF